MTKVSTNKRLCTDREISWKELLKIVSTNNECTESEAASIIEMWIESGDIIREDRPLGKHIYKINIA